MSSTSSQLPHDERSRAIAFVILDAAMTGAAAVARLLQARREQITHAIVRREDHGEVWFYRFDTTSLLLRLLSSPTLHQPTSDLKALLDLRESGQSPTVTEQETPVAGAVVVRGNQAVVSFRGRTPWRQRPSLTIGTSCARSTT